MAVKRHGLHIGLSLTLSPSVNATKLLISAFYFSSSFWPLSSSYLLLSTPPTRFTWTKYHSELPSSQKPLITSIFLELRKIHRGCLLKIPIPELGMEPRNQHFNRLSRQAVLGKHGQLPACKIQSWLLSLELNHPYYPNSPSALSPTPSPQKAILSSKLGFSLLTVMSYTSPVPCFAITIPFAFNVSSHFHPDFEYHTKLFRVSISLQAVLTSPYTEFQIHLTVSFTWQLVMCCLLNSSVPLFYIT